MKKPMYLLDYMNKQKPIFIQGDCNLIQAQCGSGKTYWCLDCIVNEESIYYSEKNLYVTDTSALRESVKTDYFRVSGKVASQNNDNMNVITYKLLANIIQEKLDNGEDLEEYFSQYDKIFLDEVHQLFIYAYKYDDVDDEEQAKYELIIDNLQVIMNSTILVCLSATPKHLYNHFQYNLRQLELVHDIIPSVDIPKLKAYSNRIEHKVPNKDSLRQLAHDIELDENEKLFIFCNTIRELKEYEHILTDNGYSCTTLWSTKSDRKMTKKQLKARQKLLDFGEYDSQVLLLNGAYESGINIENAKNSQKQTIYVMVASASDVQVTQARGRIRHDIDTLFYLLKDEELLTTERDYDELYDTLEQLEYICQNDEEHYTGKDGLNDISTMLDIWFKYNGQSKRQKATSIKKINEVLECLDLPFNVTKRSKTVRNGKKTSTVSHYVIERIE